MIRKKQTTTSQQWHPRGKKFSVVVPHSEGGHPEKIVLKIDDAKP
ncbi:hypothetical protein [Aeoliella straminimaris]|nr:hypothetical protein [Aeoliella straminimaris]